MPSWLAWQARVTKGDEGLLVAYTLTNTGNQQVVLDAARLTVSDSAGKPVSGVSLSREDTSGLAGRVGPGGIESGVIKIPAASTGGLTVKWPIVEIGGYLTYVLTDSVQPPSP